jgi:putative transcription antitermination factor YqgF
MKILALDLGEKRTGLALLNEEFIVGAGTIGGYGNLQKMLAELDGVLKKEGVTQIVYGLPFSKSGEQGEKYKAIASAIGKRFKLPMASIDETLTTVEAQRRNGKEHEDNEEAAKIILEDYLNQRIAKKQQA